MDKFLWKAEGTKTNLGLPIFFCGGNFPPNTTVQLVKGNFKLHFEKVGLERMKAFICSKLS